MHITLTLAVTYFFLDIWFPSQLSPAEREERLFSEIKFKVRLDEASQCCSLDPFWHHTGDLNQFLLDQLCPIALYLIKANIA